MEHEVSGAEVVRPLRGAVDLIDADHRDPSTILGKVFGEETFWSDEERFDLLIFDRGKNSLFHWETLLRVYAGAWHEVR